MSRRHWTNPVFLLSSGENGDPKAGALGFVIGGLGVRIGYFSYPYGGFIGAPPAGERLPELLAHFARNRGLCQLQFVDYPGAVVASIDGSTPQPDSTQILPLAGIKSQARMPLIRLFPVARYVFVLRAPRDNIRSLLNRRKLPGNLSRLSWGRRLALRFQGRVTVDRHLWGGEGEDYIGVLAQRWNQAAHALERLGDFATPVKDETFEANKLGCLQQRARQLDLDPKADVSHRLDVPFQPAGDRDVSWLDFFGKENLATIERICSQTMAIHGYSRSQKSGGA